MHFSPKWFEKKNGFGQLEYQYCCIDGSRCSFSCSICTMKLSFLTRNVIETCFQDVCNLTVPQSIPLVKFHEAFHKLHSSLFSRSAWKCKRNNIVRSYHGLRKCPSWRLEAWDLDPQKIDVHRPKLCIDHQAVVHLKNHSLVPLGHETLEEPTSEKSPVFLLRASLRGIHGACVSVWVNKTIFCFLLTIPFSKLLSVSWTRYATFRICLGILHYLNLLSSWLSVMNLIPCNGVKVGLSLIKHLNLKSVEVNHKGYVMKQI